MTKIIFVSDIHLNLRKYFDFEKNRFLKLKQTLSKMPGDILVLGGDIFDKAHPTLDEINCFYSFIFELKTIFKSIFVISGNHEDISDTVSTYDKLPEVGFTFFDFTENPIDFDGVDLYFVSHHRIHDINKIKKTNKESILFSHIRANIGVVKEEINLQSISRKFSYTILGDIHQPYEPYPNVMYCGSPYNIQFEESKTTGVFQIILDKGKVEDITFVDTSYLPQKIKYDFSVDTYNKTLPTLLEDNLYKIFIHDTIENVKNLHIPENVFLVVGSLLDDDDIDTLTFELKQTGQVNVIDTLLAIIKRSNEIDEHSFAAGLKLIDQIKQEIQT